MTNQTNLFSEESPKIGPVLHNWCRDLWPIPRSLTGPGVRTTLNYLNTKLGGRLNIHAVPSGQPVFDWTIPDEWTIRDAWIEDGQGEQLIDFQKNNLHVIGYSEPVDQWLDLGELQQHLYSIPELPNAIPYITSYYKRRWGFCLSEEKRRSLVPGRYRAVVDSDLQPGVLNYGELVIPGETEQEVLLSTYICHPSMANNELSGPVVTTAIAQWLESLQRRRYTYRIVYVPETIGSLAFLSRNLDHLKSRVVAGFNVSCVGDERCYSYLPSRKGDTPSDQVAKHVLLHIDPNFISYTWLDRGSDERQYCSPGIDLPIASIMRSKYGTYPEYHTSLDNLSFVTPDGLSGGYWALKRAILTIEENFTPITTVLGEPQLGRRGLYSTLGARLNDGELPLVLNILTYCDGQHSLLDIADLIGKSFFEVKDLAERLEAKGLIARKCVS